MKKVSRLSNELVAVGDDSPAQIFEMPNPDDAKAYMENYQKVCESLLTSSDYQQIKINGKPQAFKKKSAWRKIAAAFNISDDILEKEIIRDDNYQIISATFYVIATAPNGRSGVGSASCSIFDKIKHTDKEQPSNFELRKRFNNAENDVLTTAHTRAKSRAIADLVGMGELSAEELEGMEIIPKSNKPKPKPKGAGIPSKPKAKPKTPSKAKSKTPGIDEEAIEVEIVESKKRMSIKDLMDSDKNIKKAVKELQDENLSVNRDAIKSRLITHLERGVLSEEDYEKAKSLME